jgi:hypothetical protein
MVRTFAEAEATQGKTAKAVASVRDHGRSSATTARRRSCWLGCEQCLIESSNTLNRLSSLQL